mgnify:CR=1 FL=1
MISTHYVVTGKERNSRFWLKPDKLATGFRKGAERFLSRDKAQAAADTENVSHAWRFKWVVVIRQVDAVTQEECSPALDGLSFNEQY